jgi:hypothetical protein
MTPQTLLPLALGVALAVALVLELIPPRFERIGIVALVACLAGVGVAPGALLRKILFIAILVGIGFARVALDLALGRPSVTRADRKRAEAAKETAQRPKLPSATAAQWTPHEPVPRQLPESGGPLAPVDLFSMQPAPKTKRGIPIR